MSACSSILFSLTMDCIRRNLILIILLVSTSTMVGGQLDPDTTGCEPNLADNCFKDVIINLQCQTYRRNVAVCQGRNTTDLCNSIDDALQCTSDVIDTDCGQKQGRDRFDAWLRGLRAVYYGLCGRDRTTLNALTQSRCWNPLSFIACTEEKGQIGHVNDLLRTRLDMNECNRLLISMSVCNAKAVQYDPVRKTTCSLPVENISEIIHTFFSATECGRVCTSGSNSNADNRVPKIALAALFLAIRFFQRINQ